jgi:hypothetical protein
MANIFQMTCDDESLFGSPPPSPTLEKSPVLALPGDYTGLHAHNVGTIALPGSHPDSECSFTTFIAPSLGRSDHDQPTEQRQSVDKQTPWSSQAIPLSGTSKSSQKRKRSRQPSQSQPSVPPIDFPDPGRPIPKNFLRNQQALLGTAGLIARVKPSQLLRIAGDHASNPIEIDSDNFCPDKAPCNRVFPVQSTTSHLTPRTTPEGDNPPLCSSGPTPAENHVSTVAISPVPRQDVIASLMHQQDVFPIVRSIMKLIAHTKSSSSSAAPPSLSLESPAPPNIPRSSGLTLNQSINPVPSSRGPSASKRRKLKNVPAGAEDWDIPFPFSSGEGPEAYRETWEHERGRRLIMQLATLVKAAAQRAATKASSNRSQRTNDPGIRPLDSHVISAVGQKEVIQSAPEKVQHNSQTLKETGTTSLSPSATYQSQPSYDEVIASLLDGVLSPPAEPGGEAIVTHSEQSPHDISKLACDTGQNYIDDWFSCLNGPMIPFSVADDNTSSRGIVCPNTPSPSSDSNEGSTITLDNPISDTMTIMDPVLLETSRPTDPSTSLPISLHTTLAPTNNPLASNYAQDFESYPFNLLSDVGSSADSCNNGHHSNSFISDSSMKAKPALSDAPTINRSMRSEVLDQARARVARLQTELDAQKRRILDMEMEAAVLHHLETSKVWSTSFETYNLR